MTLLKYQALLEFNIQSRNLFTNAFIVDDFFISAGIAFHCGSLLPVFVVRVSVTFHLYEC